MQVVGSAAVVRHTERVVNHCLGRPSFLRHVACCAQPAAVRRCFRLLHTTRWTHIAPQPSQCPASVLRVCFSYLHISHVPPSSSLLCDVVFCSAPFRSRLPPCAQSRYRTGTASIIHTSCLGLSSRLLRIQVTRTSAESLTAVFRPPLALSLSAPRHSRQQSVTSVHVHR